MWEAAAIAAGAQLAGTYMQNQAAKSSAKKPNGISRKNV